MTHPLPSRDDLHATLRQMLAALERERHALAALDIEEILGCAASKRELCGTLAAIDPDALDEECRAMAEAARRLNEVNLQIRNLVAANVAARLDTLAAGSGAGTGVAARYHASGLRLVAAPRG